MNIIIAGDYVPCGRVRDKILLKDYSFLSEVKMVLESADYGIVNLECPVVTEKVQPIDKVGPALCCDQNGVEALRWAGFDCVTLANNHFYDFGECGIRETIETCEKCGVEIVGGGRTYEEAISVLYKCFDGETVAVINCCEYEFSIASNKRGGANHIDPVRLYYDIREAKERADYVVVIVHGGHEHFQLPSFRMVNLYRFFVDNGADAVINHHQHCYSGYEEYKGKPIFYGLGNFCFDVDGIKKTTLSREGYMVSLFLRNNGIDFKIIPFCQKDDSEPRIHMLKDDAFDDRINELNRIIGDKELLRKSIDEYYTSLHDNLRVVLSPINNRLLRAAMYRHLLPIVLSKKYLLRLEDFFLCESHRDKMEHFFSEING